MYADAIRRPRAAPIDLSAALDASGVVGAWSWSARSDRCILDAGAAEILAGDPGLASRPIPLETARARIHPDDRPAVVRHFRSLRERGGLFVAEYRTVSPEGRIRRILDRGRIVAGGPGRCAGHGLIIDVTEGTGGGRPPIEPPDALSAAVDHAIDCRDALDCIADPELQLLVDMLLLRLGRMIAEASAPARRRGH